MGNRRNVLCRHTLGFHRFAAFERARHAPTFFRLALELCQIHRRGIRTIPVLLWAIVFVILVGLGPLAGTFGIAAYTVGYLAKIYADLFEGADPEIIEAVQSTGASKLQLVRFVIIPESANAILAQVLFMLEYNIRASSVLGFVGAGGLGLVIQSICRISIIVG